MKPTLPPLLPLPELDARRSDVDLATEFGRQRGMRGRPVVLDYGEGRLHCRWGNGHWTFLHRDAMRELVAEERVGWQSAIGNRQSAIAGGAR